MKKLLLSVALATALAGAAPLAQAATAPANFNVTVNLTSKCEVTAGPTDVAFTYTSFQAGPAPATGGAFSVRCTNSLPYTMALDATSGTVIGLAYTLGLSAASGTGAGLTAASYSVTGSMIAGQSGDCATTAVCSGTQARILTVTY
jgi:phage tail tape-measure protein